MTGKYLKYLKYLKKEKSKSKAMALASLVSFQKQKQKQSIYNVFATLILFKSKSSKVRTLPGCSVLTIENQKGACNQGKTGEIFIVFNRS